VLSVILEQGVDPSGAEAGLLVGGVRADGSGAAPDGGAAGGVGDDIFSPNSWVIRRA